MSYAFTFRPYWGKTVQVTASNPSASVTVSSSAGTLRVVNTGTQTVYISMGRGTASADASTSLAIPGNGVETFSNPDGLDTLAAFIPSGSAVVNVTPGEGI